jgi:aryl-alcohol dehydrogenase-like predicted oxidoreductase
MSGAQLALGTVQFGLAYGIAGTGQQVSETAARDILTRAWALGIRRLDTAPGYGSIEERLPALIGDLPFSIVTKVPALGEFGGDAEAALRKSVRQSRARLGARIAGILFHDAEDLEGPRGERLWKALTEETENAQIALGLSCYAPSILAAEGARFPIRMAQVPANAFDQRLQSASPAPDIEITVRSLFLQGLLVLPEDIAAERVPAARTALTAWTAFCRARSLSPLQAALAIAKGFDATYCVVGVETVGQLEEIVAAWRDAEPIAADELAQPNADIIDPRRWKASA